jgi:hypothetical protein
MNYKLTRKQIHFVNIPRGKQCFIGLKKKKKNCFIILFRVDHYPL